MKKFTKSLVALGLAAVTAFGCAAFAGCSGEEDYKAVQLDLNPSVEFIVDGSNKVVSVTALNDDGAVVISGEAYVGKTVEDAVGLFVDVSVSSGYLVQGSATASKDTISVSVSGNADEAKNLYEKINASASKKFEESNIAAVLEQGSALKTEALRASVKLCYPELSEDEIAAMTEEQLTQKLYESRKETEKLISAEMRNAYYEAKAYRINITENQAFSNAVGEVGAAYQILMNAFDNGIELLKTAVEKLEKAQYDYLISAESDYQVALSKLLTAKKDVLQQRKELAAIEDEAERTVKEALLAQKQALLTAAEGALQTAYAAADASVALTKAGIVSAIDGLTKAKSALPDDITSVLTDKASEIEKEVNAAKDGFFAEFEKDYEAAIKAYNDKVAAVKANA